MLKRDGFTNPGRRWKHCINTLLTGGVLFIVSASAHADASTSGYRIPGYELVYDAPVETTLTAPDLRPSDAVWISLFDNAQRTIELGQFYVANQAGTRFDNVLQHLRAAGERGVRIRLLLEEKGLKISTQDTLEQLKTIPNLELRVIPFERLSGGIVHAKYLLVDGKQAYMGSQNLDWRALEHIHETGLLIDDLHVVNQISAIFEQDWQAQARLAHGETVPPLPAATQPVDRSGNYLVASPKAFNPAGVIDSEEELPRLLAEAQQQVRIQVMDYVPLSYGPDKTRPYYAVIDNAIRAAAARGVQIELIVSEWSTKMPNIAYLKSLAVLPNIQIKTVSIPQASSGFIPFARVIHSKIMTIDGKKAWIGTSNWSGGYLDNSRNLEMVIQNPEMAQRVDMLYTQLWDSAYAHPLRIDYDYPRPDPGGMKEKDQEKANSPSSTTGGTVNAP
ncbi:phospholipase D-like domain-containing protein [Pectobacterium aroidearum]|uniref:phospholipase D-like domain-containing protein n=1 Tax=Pectobacterium aroidearum TaxID=1201031 RepID=UPI002113FF48|nr:phospholipase D-like domain-containing protein [Pectobacterium aroidearum]UUE58508.1 phospholipase D-like domain-containing protein [Pectobacterium aroidearum]UUE71223.1 phospholipase D-like domain-containing protein [Pectobacterium aroidearum]UUE75624.1 phospholipase D-like domain-containing protein [Pectobacterium aroidearum]UUE79959.1 phospholipase D-like domain-containing protein [Pectobacterium aroidearum]